MSSEEPLCPWAIGSSRVWVKFMYVICLTDGPSFRLQITRGKQLLGQMKGDVILTHMREDDILFDVLWLGPYWLMETYPKKSVQLATLDGPYFPNYINGGHLLFA